MSPPGERTMKGSRTPFSPEGRGEHRLVAVEVVPVEGVVAAGGAEVHLLPVGVALAREVGEEVSLQGLSLRQGADRDVETPLDLLVTEVDGGRQRDMGGRPAVGGAVDLAGRCDGPGAVGGPPHLRAVPGRGGQAEVAAHVVGVPHGQRGGGFLELRTDGRSGRRLSGQQGACRRGDGERDDQVPGRTPRGAGRSRRERHGRLVLLGFGNELSSTALDRYVERRSWCRMGT